MVAKPTNRALQPEAALIILSYIMAASAAARTLILSNGMPIHGLRKQLLLAGKCHIAEQAGAAATGAFIHNRFQCGRNTVLLVTGANVSRDVVDAAICG
jgi:hypothetical protein